MTIENTDQQWTDRCPTVAEYCEKWLLMQSAYIRVTTRKKFCNDTTLR